MRQEGDCPHEVAADDGKDKGRAPESRSPPRLVSKVPKSRPTPGERRGKGQKTYTRFSPLGERNHAAAHMARMTKRPMKMEYLKAQRGG